MNSSGGNTMLRSLMKYVAAGMIVMTPAISFAAETLKLRHILTITGDENDKQLSSPDGVACNDKSILVADTGNSRLVLYSFQDKILKGGTEIRLPQLPYPVQVEFTPAGGILALDSKLRKISQISPAGAFTSYLALQGVPEPAAFAPRSFKVDATGAIYLLDLLGERVLIADAAGKYLDQIPLPKTKGFFSDLAVKPQGDVLLLDSVAASVYVSKKSTAGFTPFEPFAQDLGKFLNFANYITTDNRGVVYIVDHNGGAVVSLSQDGAFLGRQLNLGWKSGTLFYPGQICVTPTSEIFVADRGNSIVQAFEILK
jgi:DNA-binding beta-propeller fold protein YncE